MSTDRPDVPIAGTAPRQRTDGQGSTSPAPDQQSDPSTADAGREVAGHARSEAEEATGHVAEAAQEVAETAKSEVRDVVDEARDAVRQQADRQAGVAAETLGRFRDDLQAMSRSEAPRDATAEYVERAASSLDNVVSRLERDGIEGALSGMRGFAQRSPASFLLASAGAGFALGRILRNGDHPQEVGGGQGASSSASGGSASSQRDGGEIDLTDRAQPLSAEDVENRSLVERGVR